VVVVPFAANAVAAQTHARAFALAYCVFEDNGVVSHKYEVGFLEIVQVHIGVLLPDFERGWLYSKAERVPLAPVAVAAYVYRGYARVAVIPFG